MKIYKISKKKDFVSLGKMSDMEKAIVEFFKNNPNPSDEGKGGVHEWAKRNKYDKHKVEEAIYKLFSVFVKFVVNGRANEKDVREEDVDPKELAIGIKVEMEHTTDKETAKRISLDHLAEVPNKNVKSDYYTRLKQMEKDMEKALEK